MHKLVANIDQSAMIKAMEFGTINDDFLHKRITAKAYSEYPKEYWPIKIYLSDFADIPPIAYTTFNDQRFLGGEYTESEIIGELKEAIDSFMSVNSLTNNLLSSI